MYEAFNSSNGILQSIGFGGNENQIGLRLAWPRQHVIEVMADAIQDDAMCPVPFETLLIDQDANAVRIILLQLRGIDAPYCAQSDDDDLPDVPHWNTSPSVLTHA